MTPNDMAGAFVVVNPESGRIEDVYLIASDDQAGTIVLGALARITTPYHWSWLKNLIRQGKNKFRKRGAA